MKIHNVISALNNASYAKINYVKVQNSKEIYNFINLLYQENYIDFFFVSLYNKKNIIIKLKTNKNNCKRILINIKPKQGELIINKKNYHKLSCQIISQLILRTANGFITCDRASLKNQGGSVVCIIILFLMSIM